MIKHKQALPAFKPVLVLLFLTSFVQLHAQQCSTYTNANAANYLTRINNKGFGAGYINPFFVDMDDDGDLDCYVSDVISAYKLRYFKNIGTKTVPLYEQANPAGGFSVPIFNGTGIQQFADLDGDGDFDCFIIPYNLFGTQTIRFFENVGSKTKPAFVQNDDLNPLSFVTGTLNLYFTIADIDGDGDLDLYYSDVYHDYLYKNTGSRTKPVFELISMGNLTNNSRLYYDWNKDGLMDYFDSKGLLFYRNTGPRPEDLNYVLDPTGPTFGGLLMVALNDITGDGVPEAFSNESDMLTVTPVATIKATDTLSVTKAVLQAYPENENFMYRWQFNGADIEGATSDSYVAARPGLYTVKISGDCGTGVSLPYKFRLHATNMNEAIAANDKSLNSESMRTSFKIYPNLFTQQFNLHINTADVANTTIKIIDAMGKTRCVTKATGNTTPLGNNLSKGIYIVQLLQDGRLVYTQKVIKE